VVVVVVVVVAAAAAAVLVIIARTLFVDENHSPDNKVDISNQFILLH